MYLVNQYKYTRVASLGDPACDCCHCCLPQGEKARHGGVYSAALPTEINSRGRGENDDSCLITRRGKVYRL